MITIDKAVEILELNLKEAGSGMPPDCEEAVKLGVEALVRIQYQRKKPTVPHNTLLPGETRE